MSARLDAIRHRRAALALRVSLCVSLGATFGAAGSAHAQAVVSATASIDPAAAAGANGALTVNQTAGLDNAQSNQLTITSGGTAGANVNTSLQGAGAKAYLSGARASIGAHAFSNTSGAVMVNQSAGVANIQSNSAQLGTAAIGVEVASDGDLSAAAATNGGRAQFAQASGIREARISNTAFTNATGIVQVNQTVGAGNATANSFVLRPPAGTLF